MAKGNGLRKMLVALARTVILRYCGHDIKCQCWGES